MADINTQKLFHELKSGDLNAFDSMFKEYYAVLCREARGFFRNNDVAEEIVCDVFLKVWKKREELDVTGSLKDYLSKAVYNNCINYYRADKVQEKLKAGISEQLKERYALIDLGQDPLEYTITNDLEVEARKAIELLPPRYKEAFILSRRYNLPYDEIARVMGISTNGVKMNIKKALEQLREKLADYLKVIVLFITLSIASIFL
ncbi:MAG TPA: RNA polymerase sigma-70 factor [Bacteroidales bacterium]|nr:RNA polymerase sigma-70 factor [Bacteroidales bacterium]